MLAAAYRDNEESSLAALRDLDVLDSDPEAEFDALVRAAAAVCGAPISLISLIDADRQWFKANVGLPGYEQTPRDIAFCAHTVRGDELFEIPDATRDPRFADNPLVTSAPNVRFYAGAPLRLVDGSRIGTLCVIDRQPRRLDDGQREVLRQLAVAAARALEGRRAVAAARRATFDLAASEARFRTLSECAPLGVYHANALGECIYTNPRWQEIYGLTLEQSLGQDWTQALHPRDRDAVFAGWQLAAATRTDFDMEFRIVRPDQSVREVRSRARVVAGAHRVVGGYVGAVEDVTEVKQLEAFLDRTGRLAGVGGWEVDLRNNALTWSAQTRRIHEVEPHYAPTVAQAISFYAPEAQPIITAAVQAGIERGEPFDVELRLITGKGRAIWVRTFGEVAFEAATPIRLIGAVQDVTEVRQRRQELHDEHALRVQIERHAAETSRLLSERSEMLDVLAHEVRQPLNNASAALQSAAGAIAGPHAQVVSPRLSRAQSVLSQVLGSIDNTLAVASLLARPDPIQRDDTDIDALIEVVIADLPAVERDRVSVERQTRTRTASMDMSLMRLALRNVLTNALKYSAPGAPVRIRLADSDKPLAMLFDIIDAGGGIRADLVPRLFERDVHRGQPRQQLGQGLGLGLYIVRRVMELHGGSVSLVRNTPGGATMRLLVVQPLGD